MWCTWTLCTWTMNMEQWNNGTMNMDMVDVDMDHLADPSRTYGLVFTLSLKKERLRLI